MPGTVLHINGSIGCPHCDRVFSFQKKATCMKFLQLHLKASHEVKVTTKMINDKILHNVSEIYLGSAPFHKAQHNLNQYHKNNGLNIL